MYLRCLTPHLCVCVWCCLINAPEKCTNDGKLCVKRCKTVRLVRRLSLQIKSNQNNNNNNWLLTVYFLYKLASWMTDICLTDSLSIWKTFPFHWVLLGTVFSSMNWGSVTQTFSVSKNYTIRYLLYLLLLLHYYLLFRNEYYTSVVESEIVRWWRRCVLNTFHKFSN